MMKKKYMCFLKALRIRPVPMVLFTHNVEIHIKNSNSLTKIVTLMVCVKKTSLSKSFLS